MDPVPLEYIWQYNPVTGRVGGANQNYGQRINVLHTNRYLYNRMQNVQKKSNERATERGLLSLKGGSTLPAIAEDEPAQLNSAIVRMAGLNDLNPVQASDTSNLQNLANIALEAAEHNKATSSLLTTEKFVEEFPPVVYENPFSGSNFAYEFNPLYSPSGNEFSNPPFKFTGGAISLTGQHPVLSGGAVILSGQNPVLDKA